MKKNIAVVYGGFSSEYQISIQSGKNIASLIDHNRYNVWEVLINKDNWLVENKYPIDKNDFSFVVENKTIKFDAVVIAIHGTPGEDGILQSYFELISMPYVSCNSLSSALTFNKYYCNQYLKSLGIKIANSLLIRQNYDLTKIYNRIIKNFKLPIFIKPNAGGSSFGTTKVKEKKQIMPAIKEAFNESDEVIIEEFIQGRELTCGVLKYYGNITPMTPIEVVSKNEFFDYQAKYNPELNQEIIPAPIDFKIIQKVKQTSEKIYHLLNCNGIVRIDYILNVNNELYFLELNSIPGMTAASIVPKMAQYDNIPLTEVYTQLIDQAIDK